jgi:hypothetical protein
VKVDTEEDIVDFHVLHKVEVEDRTCFLVTNENENV